MQLCRDHIVYAPSQWEPTLQYNVVSHWLGAYPKWPLVMLREKGVFWLMRTIKYNGTPSPFRFSNKTHEMDPFRWKYNDMGKAEISNICSERLSCRKFQNEEQVIIDIYIIASLLRRTCTLKICASAGYTTKVLNEYLSFVTLLFQSFSALYPAVKYE